MPDDPNQRPPASVPAAIAANRTQPASVELRELEKKEKEKAAEAARLRIENEQLKKELHLLKYDKFYLEKFARENFGLSKTNELIFKFE